MTAFPCNLLLATAQQYFECADDAQPSFPLRRSRVHAAGVAFSLCATPQLDSGAAVTGFLLWVAAITLLILSLVHRRFPAAAVAAAGVAKAALEPIFELLN